jgi:hypothetical protein
MFPASEPSQTTKMSRSGSESTRAFRRV